MELIKLEVGRHSPYGFSNDPKHPLVAKVRVVGNCVESVITLDEQTAQRVIALISQEIAEAGRRVAETMVANVIEASAGIVPLPAPAPEPKEFIEPADLDDEIPF